MLASKNRIILREYEHLDIGEVWNAEESTIGNHQVELLEQYQEKAGRRLFEIKRKKIVATNWVGSIGLGNCVIDVVPKIDSGGRDIAKQEAMNNLIHMIKIAGLVPFTDTDVSELQANRKPMIIAYMELYIRQLAKEWRKGKISLYVSEEYNRPYLKGKLLFPENLRHNIIRKERFFTRSDEFSFDNCVTQILLAALVQCHKQRLNPEIKMTAQTMLAEFDGVGPLLLSSQQIEAIPVDRRYQRFAKLLDLAKLILLEISPESRNSSQQIYSLMFDMNIIFERYIAAELRKVASKTGLRVTTQASGKSLLYQVGRGSKFRLRPDICAYEGKQLKFIIDTKWKKLDLSKPHNKVSQSDMYQMYAYGKEFQCPRTILLYPQFGDLPEHLTSYKHHAQGEGDDHRVIEVRTVDVSTGNGGSSRFSKDLIPSKNTLPNSLSAH